MNDHNSLPRTYLSQSVGYNQTHFGIASFLNARKETCLLEHYTTTKTVYYVLRSDILPVGM
jgi:hypothetical protein